MINTLTGIKPMTATLIAIAGPLAGRTFALTEEVSIGRDSSNTIALEDRCVSRRHCRIHGEGEKHAVVDLESRNGTFVNGIPVKNRTLENGDRISVGNSIFHYQCAGESLPLQESPVEIDEGMFLTQSTLLLRSEDALYLQADRMLAALGKTPRVGMDLHRLLLASTKIGSIHDLEKLGGELLRFIFEVVPAERGAILLGCGKENEFDHTIIRSRASGTTGNMKISGTVIRRVLQEGISLLYSDVLEDPTLATQSIRESKARSLICVPLLAFEGILGAIYLDTADIGARFDDQHLQLMLALARIAAGAFESALRITRLQKENRSLREELRIEHNMIGESAEMKRVYQFIAKVAPTDMTVLIRGESGTGKELVAQAIHRNSKRADEPFVAINCAALAETLLEAELFGHERGAFTGAVAQKKGKLEIADGGSVFLDEVGEISPGVQAKLLRALQTHRFERVGGTRPIETDIRVIAATNRELEDAIRDGTFRQDLYYRINVLALTVPPLRQRRDDIPLLAAYFAAQACRRVKRGIMGISAAVRALLMQYDWPGNVRELENAIERAVVLGAGDQIQPEDLPEALLESGTAASPSIGGYHQAINELKKELIIRAVTDANGNYTEAAKRLGLHPNHLHRIIRNMGIKPALSRQS